MPPTSLAHGTPDGAPAGTTKLERAAAAWSAILIAAWVAILLMALRFGWLNAFFFDAEHADVQGIDYFSLPKAFLNLKAGRSAFDTFGGPAYGPHLTWYLSHPALAVEFGSWLSLLPPWPSYAAFVAVSVGLMAGAAAVLAAEAQTSLTRRMVWLLLLGAFPTFWMLFVGNVQAVLVAALALVFAGLLRRVKGREDGWRLPLGLLLSLLSKPVVLLAAPLLLLLQPTRRSTAWALAVYAAASLLFEFVPALNPQGIGLGKVAWLALHPGYVRANMNIYLRDFDVSPLMQDNSIHWFNLVAQSQMRLMHVDVFSLPVFFDTLIGARSPDFLFLLPTAAVLLASAAVALVPAGRAQMELALLVAAAASLAFFLSYPTVWEYQYTGVLPVAAILLMLRRSEAAYATLRPLMAALACSAWLPSLYVLVRDRPLTPAVLSVIRADRVLPVTLLFALLLACVAAGVVESRRAPVTTGG